MSSPIFWTPDKDRFIYQHYPDGGASAVVPHLDGVSHGRIKNRAGVLGVKMSEKAKRAAHSASVRRGPPSDTLSKLLAAGDEMGQHARLTAGKDRPLHAWVIRIL